MEDKPTDNGRLPLAPILLSIYLIGTFLWRAFAAAHEFPSPTLRNLTIGLDLACLVALIGLWIKASRDEESPVGPGLHVLFLIGVLAGLGMFGIRLSGSTESWWTGHIKYELSPSADRPPSREVPVAKPANTVANDTNTEANTSEPAEPDSPSAAYKAFYAASVNKDIKTLKTLISKEVYADLYRKYDQKKADKLVEEDLTKTVEGPQWPSDDTRNEKITGNTTTVECLTENGKWFTVKFVKEDGKWKLTE